jgi:hypothetical protein
MSATAGSGYEYTLDDAELEQCRRVGQAVDLACRRAGRIPQLGGDTCAAHGLGQCGELTVSRALGVPYEPKVEQGPYANHRDGDVAGFQVRTTELPYGCLIIRRRDVDVLRHPFVLVVGSPPTFRIVGWIWGRAGALTEYWRTDVPLPAWFVPQAYLLPWDQRPRKGARLP